MLASLLLALRTLINYTYRPAVQVHGWTFRLETWLALAGVLLIKVLATKFRSVAKPVI